MSTQPQPSDDTAEARQAAREAAENRSPEAAETEHTAAEHGLSDDTMERLDHSG